MKSEAKKNIFGVFNESKKTKKTSLAKNSVEDCRTTEDRI